LNFSALISVIVYFASGMLLDIWQNFIFCHVYCFWQNVLLVVLSVEVKKVDKFGCIVLPVDWCERELKDTNYVVVLKRKGELRIFPLKRVDLRKFLIVLILVLML